MIYGGCPVEKFFWEIAFNNIWRMLYRKVFWEIACYDIWGCLAEKIFGQIIYIRDT